MILWKSKNHDYNNFIKDSSKHGHHLFDLLSSQVTHNLDSRLSFYLQAVDKQFKTKLQTNKI